MSHYSTEPPQASCPRNDLLCAEGLKDAALNLGRVDKFGIVGLPQFFSGHYPDERHRTTSAMCGGSYSSSNTAGAMAAGAAPLSHGPAKMPYSGMDLKDQLTVDYSQLKRDWMRLKTQNKVAVGVAAGLGAAALITVVILAIMLARKR